MAGLVVLLVSVLLGAGLPRSYTEFGYRPLIGADHPSIVALDAFIESFGGGLPVQIAWRCEASAPCERVFDPPSLEMAHEVSARLARLAAVRDVRGPADAPLLMAGEGEVAVRRVAPDGVVAADAAALEARALTDPFWRDRLLSADGRTGAIVVQPVDSLSETSVAVVEAVLAALRPFEERGFVFHLVGHPIEFVVAGRELAESSAALTPITGLVVALVLWALTRSWQAVLATLVILGVALAWTFGALGWLGWPQDAILQTLAPLILVVGVCDAVHLLSQRAPPAVAGRPARRAALERAAAEVSGPCLVTTLTTAVAFLSFATSDLATFVRFGVISSIGVVFCLLLTFALLPLLLVLLPPEAARAERTSRAWDAALRATSNWGRRRSGSILVGSGLLFVLCAVSWAAWLRVDTDGYEMYGEQSQVIRWIRFVEHELRRSDDLELEVALPPQAELFQVATLEALRDVGSAVSAVDGLGRPTSVVDAVARANRLFHDDDPGFERIASSAGANGELLELIAFQDPAFLAAWVSLDRRRLRISVEAEFQSFREREVTLAAVQRVLDASVPPGFKVQMTGAFSVGRDWVRDVQATQLRSFAAAAVLVFVLVWGYLRSLRWASLAMLPTLLPVVVILGAMGAAGLSLDVGRSMIAAVILGIGIDDTIHLLSRFRLERAAGRDMPDAMSHAVRAIGRPVVTTSIALALGFLSLVTSSWQTVSSFGFFVSLGVLGALIADLWVLPALVFALGRHAR